MSKAEAMHELYETLKGIDLDEADEMVINTKDEDEKSFIRMVTDDLLQMQQKKVIAEKRF